MLSVAVHMLIVSSSLIADTRQKQALWYFKCVDTMICVEQSAKDNSQTPELNHQTFAKQWG